MGISELNDMQQDVINHFLHCRNDIVVLSPTGTGKTLAYLLPLVQFLDAQSDAVQALVVVPGRELALQSNTVQLSMGSGIRSQACYGGRTAMDEHRLLKKNHPQLIFGTPGRLNDHLDKGNIDKHLIKYIVIDEFDKCLEMGFQDEMSHLLGKLPMLERRFLLSATDTDIIPRYVEMRHTDRLDYLIEEERLNDRVEVYGVQCPVKDKLDTLAQLLKSLGETQSVVFLNYRDSVERTDQFLRKQGFVTSVFHGGMEQRQREDALYKFSNGSATVLVSTDLASQSLVHRIGRTARWDKVGRTFFLVGPEEHIPGFVESLAQIYEPSADELIPQPCMATLYIGKGRKDKISKGDIVGFLCKKGGLKTCEIGRIDVSDRYAYAAVKREKLQQIIRLTRGEKIKGVRTVVEPVR